MAKPPIVDAEYVIVTEVPRKPPSLLTRFGWWCVTVLIKTAIAGVFALVTGAIVIFGFGIRDDAKIGWAALWVGLGLYLVFQFLAGIRRGLKE